MRPVEKLEEELRSYGWEIAREKFLRLGTVLPEFQYKLTLTDPRNDYQGRLPNTVRRRVAGAFKQLARENGFSRAYCLPIDTGYVISLGVWSK